ncbi:hypothetical protein K9M41_03085 [Candidatus Gracilibacteria bacterium]|nr:hypothetical protein [Candidatus Gracilibacteria bacterium]
MDINPREQAIAFLRRSQKILIVTREKWTGDEVAGTMALQKVLHKAGKEVIAVASQEVPKNLKFLGGEKFLKKDLGEEGDFVISLSTEKAKVERVKYTIKDKSVDILVSPKNGFFSPSDVSFQQSAGKFDLIVVLGAENLDEVGTLFESHTQLFATTPIVNVAVSAGNDFFGKVNLVDPAKSSVCEIIFELIQSTEPLRNHLDKELATVLLAGIISKTGSFQEPETTASAFEVAAKLQELGARQADIIDHIFKMKQLPTLKIWGRILGNLEMDGVHRIAWSGLAKADFELAEADPEQVENMTEELLRHTQGAELVALFIEQKKCSAVQIRSGNPNIDFTQLRKTLGGGGELVPHGIDLTIPKKTVAEIQFEILRLIVEFQKERLHISEEIELQKMELGETVNPSQTELPITGSPSVSPTPPANIPFEAPFQQHEINGSMSESIPPGTRAAEVTIDPNQKGIPDWLKKGLNGN